METAACISLHNATLGYRKKGQPVPVIRDLSLDFFSGDFIGIAGLNGIGKSTLLKSLSGLLPLLSGSLRLGGDPIAALSLEAIAKKIAVVLTEKIGGFNLTAYDVVAAGQIPYTNAFHQLKKENREIIERAIAASGIEKHQHKPMNELSDGLFQKTVIAKALAQQTPVMLLDEPSAFLDYASKHELFRLLRHLTEQQAKCILVSSHDLDLVLKYCNKILVISAGSVELITVTEARQNTAFMSIGGGFL